MSVTKDGKVWVCRGELRLARQAVDSLRKVPLSPDPLSVFARAMEEVDHARGELAEIAMDLLPATPGRRRRLVKRLTRQGAGHHSGGGAKLLQDIVDELTGGAYAGRGTRTNGSQKREPVDVVAQRRGLQSTAEKLLTPEGMFETQVLVRTEARNEQRADALFRGVLQAFEVFAGENNLRVSGLASASCSLARTCGGAAGGSTNGCAPGFSGRTPSAAGTSSTSRRSPGCSSRSPRGARRTASFAAARGCPRLTRRCRSGARSEASCRSG
jgi:hypothetical protein